MVVSANSEELLVALIDAFDSDRVQEAIHAWLEGHPADPLAGDEPQWDWLVQSEPEPEIYLSCGFRFFGAPMAELEAVASQRRFEKPAVDWQDTALQEHLEAMPDVVAVYEGSEEGDDAEFSHYALGNVHIDVE